MWWLAICLLLVSAVTVADARHGCTTCPSNACPQNEARNGFCNEEGYVSESYKCSHSRSESRSRETNSNCGWWRSDRCPRRVTYYVTVTRYSYCYRRRLSCQRRCCSGFQFKRGRCEPCCTGGCRNGGVCIDPEVCECPSSYQGQYCEVAICSGGCLNGGLCADPDTCSCPSGWIGTNCETDIDECTTNTSGCDHKCTNTLGSYFCTCQDGFTLSNDNHSCTDINECNSTDKGGCDHICSNTLGSYNCSCNDGFAMLEENNTCIEIQAGPEPDLEALGLDNSGVAAVSGVAVCAVVAGLVLCVVVAIVVKLRAPFCEKAAKDKGQDTEPTPEDYGGFELSPNPAYGEISYVKIDKSQDEEAQPAKDNDDDGNVYVSTKRELPAYENLQMLY